MGRIRSNKEKEAKEINLVDEVLDGLRKQLNLSQYPKTTKRIQQEAYAVDIEELSSELRQALDDLLDAMVDAYSDIKISKKPVELETAMPRMAMIYRLLGVIALLKKSSP